tara:strand:- start:9 stop:503 length:495 start_codon:yes stop_codon:yes gene_type:complete
MDFHILKENLNTMSKVRINDKLIICDNVIKINKPSLFRPLYRFVFKQSRVKSNIFLIKLIDAVIWEMDNFITSKDLKNPIIFKSQIKNNSEYIEFQSIMDQLKLSIGKLSVTYRYDTYYVRQLNSLIDRINKVNPEYYSYWAIRRNKNLPIIDEEGNYRESVTF